jgi:hypothetical protein
MQLPPALMASIVAATMLIHPDLAMAQTVAVDRPAAIQHGNCGGVGDVVAPLAHLVLTEGESQGYAGATPVEQSGTVVDYTLSQLLAAEQAVVVLQSPNPGALPVACGEIGGAINPDGTLAIGMGAVNGSGLSGVTYFTPIAGYDKTLVSILLVDGGLSEPQAGAAGADGANGADGQVGQPGQPGQPGADGVAGGSGGNGGNGGDGGAGGAGGAGGNGGDGGAGGDAIG